MAAAIARAAAASRCSTAGLRSVSAVALVALGFLGQAQAAKEHWAVVIAGSKDFINYRHQADVCHACRLLREHGLPRERVITMLADDVAHARENPFPGQLFNHPAGEDVYTDCHKDYTGAEVNPQNFLAVLTGDAAAAGGRRVLNSTADDNVFVYFVDHGAVGLIAFPDMRVLHARKLTTALVHAHARGLFAELVFYLETCESGSMFEGLLPKGLPVYAVTAANASESSWGTYCPPYDVVAGVHVGTCLGDLFSVSWMRYAERRGAMRETLHAQVVRTRAETNLSHVQQFGDTAMSYKRMVGDFEGASATPDAAPAASVLTLPPTDALAHASAIDSRVLPLRMLAERFARTRDARDGEALVARVRAAQQADELALSIARAYGLPEAEARELVVAPHGAVAAAPASAVRLDGAIGECHEMAAHRFSDTCGGWSEERLRHSATLYRLCEHARGRVLLVVDAIARACT